ncbi:MAG: hypothetical protein WAQ98_23290 [Blastocatellia bacterium]
MTELVDKESKEITNRSDKSDKSDRKPAYVIEIGNFKLTGADTLNLSGSLIIGVKATRYSSIRKNDGVTKGQ